MKRKLLFLTMGLASTLFVTNTAKAQLSDISNITKVLDIATPKVESVLSGYLKPFGNGFTSGLGNGWYNTAKPHGSFGFDITFGVNVAFVPTVDETFDISNLKLTTAEAAKGPFNKPWKINVPTNATSPSMSGEKNVKGANVDFIVTNPLKTGTLNDTVSVPLPDGAGVPFIPTPMLQLGIGIYKQTEVDIRFIPTMSFDISNEKMKVGMWGVAVKHSISQWIPVINDLKIVNLSLLVGYTKFQTSYGIGLKPEEYKDLVPNYSTFNKSIYDQQKAELMFSALTTDLIASIDIPGITVFLSGGVMNPNSEFKLSGTYPILKPDVDISGALNGTSTNAFTIKDKVDPLSFSLTDKGMQPHFTVGGKLKMWVLHVGGSYTIAKYNMANVNIALTTWW